ncbi:hypothetical protein GVAV_002282 [Gurleya vavrai]
MNSNNIEIKSDYIRTNLNITNMNSNGSNCKLINGMQQQNNCFQNDIEKIKQYSENIKIYTNGICNEQNGNKYLHKKIIKNIFYIYIPKNKFDLKIIQYKDEAQDENKFFSICCVKNYDVSKIVIQSNCYLFFKKSSKSSKICIEGRLNDLKRLINNVYNEEKIIEFATDEIKRKK